MGKHAWVVGVALFAGAAVVVSATGQSTAVPKDVCALLTTAEIQAMAGTKIPDGTPGTVASLAARNCTYTWPAGNTAASGEYRLTVLAADASKAFPNMSTTLIKQALLARVKEGGTAGEVPGIGEAATYESNSPILANAKGLLKGVLLTVELEGPNARLKKDQVIGLLRTAAGRL
jgi:hypothetical protein